MFQIDDMLLQIGEDYITSSGICVHHPTLREIKDFGEDKYLRAINIFTATPYQYMVELDEMGIDFLTMDNYEFFLSFYSDIGNEICEILLGKCNYGIYYNNLSQETVLYDKDTGKMIDRLGYEEISYFIKRVNIIPITPPHDIENLKKKPFLKNMLLEEMKVEKEINSKRRKITQSELSNNIRFLIWNNTIGYNYSNVWDLKMYQFYEGIISLQKTDNYKWTMTGIYNGNIQQDKVKIDEVSWLSKIKIN